jgi:hypothetical protein
MEYTVEIFKRDARTRSGERLYKKEDITVNSPRQAVERHYQSVYPTRSGYRVVLFDTQVTRKNLLTGQEFTERYDVPHSCSPASEAFWSA